MARDSKHSPGRAASKKTPARVRRSAVPATGIDRVDRRQDILHSAELLFSKHGYHPVTVRDIATHAGVPLALVGYYFGKKHELLQTIFEHRKSYISDRIERMGQVDCSAANPHAVEDIIRAWAEPVLSLRAGEDAQPFAVLVARSIWEPGEEARHVVTTYYDELANVFLETMCKALPKVHRDKVVWGYEFSLGALLMLIADERVERLSKHGAKSGDAAQTELLIGFLTAGFLSAVARGASKRST
jgi:AcrR family transcriptional regulator